MHVSRDELVEFLSDLDKPEVMNVPGVGEHVLRYFLKMHSIDPGLPPKRHQQVQFIEFVDDLDVPDMLMIPGVWDLLVKYYMEVQAAEATYRPAWNPEPSSNPAGVVKTAQDERDWEKAKEYYARGARGPERSWRSPDWATVMVIYKNIKAKRKQRRG